MKGVMIDLIDRIEHSSYFGSADKRIGAGFWQKAQESGPADKRSCVLSLTHHAFFEALFMVIV